MQIICFHNPDEENGYLSNWYAAGFTYKEVYFSSMEQYMMYQKAVYFGDEAIADKILHTEDAAAIKEQGKKIGIIASDETKDLYQADEVISVGQRAHLETVTAHLYDVLREFDHKDVDMIYSEGFEGEPLSEAIMNRMVKAAGHEILRI